MAVKSKTDLGLTLPGGKIGILLLHDVGGSAAELKGFANDLASCGFTVHCPQLIALGRSHQAGHGSAGMMVSEAEAALSRLKTKCDSVVVMGLEYGAMLALELARHNAGSVQAVIAVEPRAWLPGLGSIASGLSGRLKQSWVAGSMNMVRQAARKAAPVATGTRDARNTVYLPELANLLDSVHAGLPQIKQPVMLVRRPARSLSRDDATFLMQRRLGGSVETIVVEDAALSGSIDLSLHVVADRSARFIASLIEELKVKRENDQRRQRVAAGKTDAA
jgi:carboxylesterase